MEIVGWLVNTAVLLFVAGLAVAYGRWLGGQVMSIKETLAKWQGKVALIEKCDQKVTALEKDFAVHCATQHCGEEEKKP